jgi:septum formation protein
VIHAAPLTPFVAWPAGRTLLLASQSPRRAELLQLAGLPFAVEPPGEVEAELSARLTAAGAGPAEYALALARAKAADVAARWPGRLVLGADTIVVVDGDVLEKPRDRADAARLLARLSGRRHTVITAIALCSIALCSDGTGPGGAPGSGAVEPGAVEPDAVEPDAVEPDAVEPDAVEPAAVDLAAAESTEVEFLPLTAAAIERYIATGEPMDKAGAYGIQGYGAMMVRRVEGCYFNVMGLPLARLGQLLGQVLDAAAGGTP